MSRKRYRKFLTAILATAMVVGTVSPEATAWGEPGGENSSEAEALLQRQSAEEKDPSGASADPLKGAQPPRTTYEIFTGSFADSNGDGIGDLNGVREHLDYINDGDMSTTDDLGCDGIWLTPIFPSPTYHKYDAEDYTSIDPDFGTLGDFDELLSACHERGIKLYLDLAVNHTSVEHPWFRQAAEYLKEHGAEAEDSAAAAEANAAGSDSENTGTEAAAAAGKADAEAYGITFPEGNLEECPYLGYYNFVREPRDGYTQLAGTDYYYESRFWEGMPDLNLDSEAVRGEIGKITDFWLDRGIDGFRLDAVTSYYTDDKNKSIEFLAWLTDRIKSKKADAYVVGECWADQATIADYAKSGIDSLFDFPFAGQDGTIASAVRSGHGAAAWGKAMETAEELYADANPEFIDAPFYTNHDMARSAGYYPYDDGTKAKLAGGMNLMMGGNVFIYYGEEVGLKGSGKDENKRAPMPWAAETDPAAASETEAGGESAGKGTLRSDMFDPSSVTAGPEGMDRTELKYGTAADQTGDPDSVLSYYREAIAQRYAHPAIAEGKTDVIDSLSSESVCVFTRTMKELSETPDSVLIAVNVSGEKAEIDLSADPLAAGYRTLAASLDAQSEESARAASDGSGRPGRRSGRRGERSSQETEDGTEAEVSGRPAETEDGTSLTYTSSIRGDKLIIPAYGIAVLAR